MLSFATFPRPLAAALLLAAFSTAGLADEPKRGGTLTMIAVPEPTTIVGIDNSFGATQRIGPKVTEGLLTYDFELKPHPQLATSWEVAENGLEYTFRLRDGVKWHDGKPFTSDDVAFSILTLKRTHPRGRGTFANVAEVRTPDPLTAVLVLSKPAPYLLTALSAGEAPIVPRHIYDGTDISANPNGSRPVGTGPFVFKEWVRGSHLVLERNPDYWDKPKPYLDRIVVKFIPDASARAAALETGEVLLAGDNPIPLADRERFQALPDLGIETKGYEYSGNQGQLFFNLDTPVLKDLKVRQAVAHAIDLKANLAVAWYGYGVVSPTPIAPVLKAFHDPSIKPHAFDVALAEKLLDEAGQTRGADGKRFTLRLLYNPYNDGNRRSAEYIRSALAKVGINAVIENYEFAAYVRKVYTDRAFDIEVEQLGNTFDPTIGAQRGYWSKNFKIGLGFSNASHYANPEVDRLLEAAAVEIDPAKRRELFFAFQRQVDADLPAVNLVSFQSFTVFNKAVKNHTLTADGLAANFADVWLDR